MEAACAFVDGSEQIVSDHANLKRILENVSKSQNSILIPSLGA